MSLIQTIHLKVSGYGVAQTIHAVQNDTDRKIEMILDDLVLTNGMTGKITFVRPNNTHYEVAGDIDTTRNSVTADITQALTQPGRVNVQLKITDTNVVSTFRFVILVEQDTSGTLTPEEGMSIQDAIDAANEAVSAAEDAADRAEEAAESLELDATLTVQGRAADAKATGDRVSYLEGHFEPVSKNLFNKATAVWGKKVNASTGAVETASSADNFISQKISIEPSTAYYANRNGCVYNSSGTFLEFHNINNGSNFTTPATAAYMIITSLRSLIDTAIVAKGSNVSYDSYTEAVRKSAVRTDNTLSENDLPANSKATGDKIAETKGELLDSVDTLMNAVLNTDTATGIKVVINDSVIDIPKSVESEANAIYRAGINLWNEEWELGTYSSSNDGAPSYSTTNIRSKNDSPIPIVPETDYYITTAYNLSVFFYDETDTFISSTVVYGTTKTFTSPEDAYYLRFYCVSNYGTTYNNDLQVAFNSDSEKQTYHAHNIQTVSTLSDLRLIPNGRNNIYAVASSDEITIDYFTSPSSGGKKPYESGFIVFTVPSRLTKSNNSVAADAVSEQADDSVDVNCILKLPTTYTPNGKPTKLIMICHGAGQSAESWSENANYQALTTAFVNAGYAVFDCNGYRENALGYSFWGDSRGVDVWRKAYQYVVDNYNVENTFGLYGFSMGGLTALNLMFSGFPGIKCVALGSPVVSLEACYDSESTSAVIKVLYGMGDTYEPSKAHGCDPYSRIIDISNTKYIFGALPPIKLWYGSTETGTTDTGSGEVVTGVVVKAYGEDIVNAINNAGGQAEYREIADAGHEICYGGNATANSDYVLFFDRHNKI